MTSQFSARAIHPTLLSHNAECYAILPVMGEKNCVKWVMK